MIAQLLNILNIKFQNLVRCPMHWKNDKRTGQAETSKALNDKSYMTPHNSCMVRNNTTSMTKIQFKPMTYNWSCDTNYASLLFIHLIHYHQRFVSAQSFHVF